MLSFMKLIGFQCAEGKLLDFGPKAVGLGIELDCSRSEEGLLLISNKQGRAEEVCEKDFARLMGRLQFADAQVMGKSGRLAMAEVRRWAKTNDQPTLFLRSLSRAHREAEGGRAEAGAVSHCYACVARLY